MGSSERFDRCNLAELSLESIRAHGGEGLVRFHRIAEQGMMAGACRWLDLAEVPPGATIGRHRHDEDEEEFYLILSGAALLWRDGEEQRVSAGDLVRNPPGGAHGLRNDGAEPLRMFVFAVSAS